MSSEPADSGRNPDGSAVAHSSSTSQLPGSFMELAASRREWIDRILRPWCIQAPHRELKLASLEWLDIAGKVDPDATLWTWAWSRFPALVHEGMPGVNETAEVRVTFRDGTVLTGFPDARESTAGRLVLLARSESDPASYALSEPKSIDDIASAERI